MFVKVLCPSLEERREFLQGNSLLSVRAALDRHVISARSFSLTRDDDK